MVYMSELDAIKLRALLMCYWMLFACVIAFNHFVIALDTHVNKL